MQRLQGASSPEEAAALIDQYYLRSAGTERDSRQSYARQIADYFGGRSTPSPSPQNQQAAALPPNQPSPAPNSIVNAQIVEPVAARASIAEPESRNPTVTIDPDNILSSFGAAIAASGEGRSAAADLMAIRQNRQKELAVVQQQEKAEKERRAMAQLLQGSGFFTKSGMSEEDFFAMSPEMQRQLFEQQVREEGLNTRQDNQIAATASEGDANRELRGREVALGEKKFKAQVSQWNADMAFRKQQYDRQVNMGEDKGVALQEMTSSMLRRNGADELAGKLDAMPSTAFEDPAMAGVMRDLIKSTQPIRGAERRPVDAYYLDKLNDPAVSEKEKQTIRDYIGLKAGAPTKADQVALEVMGADIKHDGKIKEDMLRQSQANQRISRAVDEVIRIASQPDFQSGIISGSTAVRGIFNAMSDLGLAVPEGVGDREMLAKLNNLIAPLLRPEGSGAASDFDARMFKAAFPDATDNPETILRLANTWRKALDAEQAYQEFVNNTVGSDGEGGYVNTADADAMWHEMKKKGDPRTNPVFMSTDFTLENYDALVARGDGVKLNDVVMMNGTPTAITSPEQIELFRQIIAAK